MNDELRAIIKRASSLYPCGHCAGSGGGAAMGWTSLCARCYGSGIELHPLRAAVAVSPEAQK